MARVRWPWDRDGAGKVQPREARGGDVRSWVGHGEGWRSGISGHGRLGHIGSAAGCRWWPWWDSQSGGATGVFICPGWGAQGGGEWWQQGQVLRVAIRPRCGTCDIRKMGWRRDRVDQPW